MQTLIMEASNAVFVRAVFVSCSKMVGSAHPYGINVPKKIAARNFPLRQFGPSHVRDWFMVVGARGAASPPSSALPGAREKIGVSQKFTSAVRWASLQ